MNAVGYDLEKIKNNTPIQEIEFFAEISSTNDRLKTLLSQSSPPNLPILALAEVQTSGRGRGTNRWWTGRGALAMSLALDLHDSSLSRDDLPQLSPMIGLAISEIIEPLIPDDGYEVEIHLPNDVYVNGRKIAGILIESPTPRHAVIGIGLNVNNRTADVPPELRDRSIATLCEILGRELDLTEMVIELLNRLFREFNRWKK